MAYALAGLCAALIGIICILACKIAALHRAADVLRTEFGQRLVEDTNVGIDLSTADRKMRRLAAEMDKQLKLVRREHLRYTLGDRELKEAVTGIAHDLRTPLTAICGYIELLRKETLPPKAAEYLQIIAGRVDSLRRLTGELFRYSVVLSGGCYESRESVVLNNALEECAAGFYGVCAARKITPEITLPSHPIKRPLNKAALSRILENAMANAMQYSSGDLFITLSPQGVITFGNHTNHLDKVTAGQLFDRFYTVTSGQQGTGLGLSIAKALTEQMGGAIAASLEGSLFLLEIQFAEN